VAGASNRTAVPPSPPSGAVAAIASFRAFHTAVASISGGSPTALERKIVASLLGALSSILTLKIAGASRLPGIL